MKITNRFLSVTISVLIGLSILTASANADTTDVDYGTNTGTVAISPIISDTPNEYKFSLPDSGKTYVLIDSYQNESGKREFFVMTDYSASGGLATDALSQNRYKFAKSSSYTWDGESENYVWNPSDANMLAGFINSDTFISAMIDRKVDEYVTVHKYKFEPASEWDKTIKSEVESRYALPSISEINHYKDRIGVKAYEYNVSSGAMTTTVNSWWLRTPPKTGGNGAMVFHGTNLVPAWQSCDNGWGKTIRPCFYLTEDFFKNVKLDMTKLGKDAAAIVNFPSLMTKQELFKIGYTEDELNDAEIYYPEAENVCVSGVATVGSVLTADYEYKNLGGNEQGLSQFEWYRVSGDGTETLIDCSADRYTVTTQDLNCEIYYTIVPITKEGYRGEKISSPKSAKVTEGECTLESFSAKRIDSEFVILIEGLNAKQSGTEIAALMNVYHGNNLISSEIATIGPNGAKRFAQNFKEGDYVKFAIYNKDTFEPMFVYKYNDAFEPPSDDSDEFTVTPNPLEDALVVHGKNEGFSADDDVIIYITKADESVPVYVGADRIDKTGNLNHSFSFGDAQTAGIYNMNIISKAEKRMISFNYSSLETRVDILENVLGKIDSEKRFAEVIRQNMRELAISDRYILGMTDKELEQMGIYLLGRSYGGNDITAFYNDLSDASAVVKITKVENPCEVAAYYSERYKFEECELYNEFKKLNNSENVFKMYFGKECLSFDDVRELFNQNVVLQIINEADSYGQIDDAIRKYKDIITFNTDKYFGSDTDKTSLFLLEKGGNFMSMAELETEINNAVKAQQTVKEPSSGRGGGTSSGSFTSGKFASKNSEDNSNNVPKPDDAENKEIFADVEKEHWAYAYIKELAEKGIVSGDDNGRFNPEADVLREEFVKMLVIAADKKIPDATCDFVDVPKNSWCYEYISAAYESGIIKGKSDNFFGISECITREDMAVMLSNMIEYTPTDDRGNFNDYEIISDYAKKPVKLLSEIEIINGFEDNTFRPHNAMTRAEAAAVITRFLNCVQRRY